MNVRPMDKSDSYKECCPVEVKELKGTRGKEQVMRIATDDAVELGFRSKTETQNIVSKQL